MTNVISEFEIHTDLKKGPPLVTHIIHHLGNFADFRRRFAEEHAWNIGRFFKGRLSGRPLQFTGFRWLPRRGCFVNNSCNINPTTVAYKLGDLIFGWLRFSSEIVQFVMSHSLNSNKLCGRFRDFEMAGRPPKTRGC